MKKIILVLIVVLLLNFSLVNAHEHSFTETKQLIDSGVGCDKLTDQQLEAIGDYYMEQMHPGEAHEMMDKMMGGEGSESLRQIHINMAKTMYCGEGGMMGSGGMMGMMNMMGGNMMGSGMMGGQTPQTNMMQGMMGNWGYFGYWNFVNVLYVMLLVGLIILIYFWIIKLWKDPFQKKRR